MNKKQILKLKETIGEIQEMINKFKNGLRCENEKKIKSGDPLQEKFIANENMEFI